MLILMKNQWDINFSYLMTGIFNNSPKKLHLLFAWNVESVLKFIKNSSGSSESLSEKYLTFKATMQTDLHKD